MTILEYLSDGKRLESYREWLNHPVTKQMAEMSREFGKPVMPNPATGENVLLQHGVFVGMSLKHDFIFDSVKVLETAAQQAASQISPDYGYIELLPQVLRDEIRKKQAKQ